MPDDLGRALEQLPVPSGERRRQQIIQLLDAASPPRRRVGTRVRTAAVAAGFGFLAVSVLAWTPFGRALADDLGGLVGIGDEPSFDQARNPDLPATGRALVVQTGTVPGTAQQFEVAGFSAHAADVSGANESGPAGQYSCLNLDLLPIESLRQVGYGLSCVDESPSTAVSFDSLSDFEDQLGDRSRYLLAGGLSANVETLEVAYRSSGSRQRVVTPAVVAQLQGELAEDVDAPVAFGRFYAFLPADADLGSPVVFTAFDEERAELGSDTYQRPVQR